MLILRKHGYGDFTPQLRCAACQQALTIQSAYLAWNVDRLDAPAVWLHQGCHRGNLRTVLGGQRAMIWRAVDVLSRLLRETEVSDATTR